MPQTIALTAIGTRGDVQPYVALALGLKKAGYGVRVVAPDNFADFVGAQGIDFAPTGLDIQQLLQSDEGKEVADQTFWQRLRSFREIKELGSRLFRDSYRKVWEGVTDADLIVYHPKTTFAVDFAEKLSVPAIISACQPLTTTAAYPLFILPWRTLGPALNRLSYRLLDMQGLMYGKLQDRLRAEVLQLPPRRGAAVTKAFSGTASPVLYAFSEHVVPPPDDWPDGVHVTGYWFLDDRDGWQPEPALAAFLEAGPAPVYIGFGSMPDKQPARTAEVVVSALEKIGARGLIARGWGGLDPKDLPATVHAIDAAPHDRLFPRTTAVVHHGGAGTTAAGLKTGRASLICPLLGDQPWWGQRIADLGCGPPPLPLKALTVDRLAERLDQLLTTARFEEAAGRIAADLAQEDGVGRAIAVIERGLAKAGRRSRVAFQPVP